MSQLSFLKSGGEKAKYLVSFQFQHKQILQKTLPETLKISIAKNIENNLFSKVSALSFIFHISLQLKSFTAVRLRF